MRVDYEVLSGNTVQRTIIFDEPLEYILVSIKLEVEEDGIHNT